MKYKRSLFILMTSIPFASFCADNTALSGYTEITDHGTRVIQTVISNEDNSSQKVTTLHNLFEENADNSVKQQMYLENLAKVPQLTCFLIDLIKFHTPSHPEVAEQLLLLFPSKKQEQFHGVLANSIGIGYANQNKLFKAQELLEIAVISSNDAYALHNLATVRLDMANNEAAIYWLEKAKQAGYPLSEQDECALENFYKISGALFKRVISDVIANEERNLYNTSPPSSAQANANILPKTTDQLSAQNKKTDLHNLSESDLSVSSSDSSDSESSSEETTTPQSRHKKPMTAHQEE